LTLIIFITFFKISIFIDIHFLKVFLINYIYFQYL